MERDSKKAVEIVLKTKENRSTKQIADPITFPLNPDAVLENVLQVETKIGGQYKIGDTVPLGTLRVDGQRQQIWLKIELSKE